MSDLEDFETESESGEDFSASEDDWQPGKDDQVSDEDDDDDTLNDTIESDDGKNKKKKPIKPKAVKKITKAPKLNTSLNRRHSSSLRAKMMRRYNPPSANVARSPVPSKVADILSNSQFKQRKQMVSTKSSSEEHSRLELPSETESSEDEGLVNPNDLDLNSEFFDVKPNTSTEESSSAPQFDCNAGMNLSASSESDDDISEAPSTSKAESHKKPSVINAINSKSSGEMYDFSSLQNFQKNLESAKTHMKELTAKEARSSTATESDVTKLLSLGEGGPSTSTNRKRKHVAAPNSDDSEWENVSEIKDIQITLGNQNQRMSRDEKKAIDYEACLKRRLNRDIKIKQVYLHKTSVMCWLAHGNYVNRVINNMTLMEMCLKQLPSKNAYPKGDTDLKYYKMVTEWFSTVFTLKSTQLYCQLKRIPSKKMSLALQIQSKKVISKSDYVLLFVTMLRSLGIQCRLVINFAVLPLHPPQKDLFVISTKKSDETDEKSSSVKSLSKKIKASVEKMKRPPKDSSSSTKSKSESKSASKSKSETESASTSKSVNKIESSSEPKIESKSQTDNKNKLTYGYPIKEVRVKLTRDKPSTSETDKKNKSNVGHPIKEVRVKLTRDKFITSETARPIAVSKNQTSQSSPTKIAKGNDNLKTDKLKSSKPDPKTSVLTEKRTKPKEIGNAGPSQEKPVKHVGSQVLVGTPTKTKVVARSVNVNQVKNKLIAKVNHAEASDAFSPVKTRSKASKVASASAAMKGSKLKMPQLDGSHDVLPKGKKTQTAKSRPKPSDSDDSDFAPSPPKRIRPKVAPQKSDKKKPKIDERVFSSDAESDVETNTSRLNFWVEAYAEKEKKWLVIDPINKKVDCVDYVRKNASKPIIYAIAWNNDNTIRDVTPRYCSHFHTNAFEPILENRNARTVIEDIEFSKLQMDSPMPTAVGEFKNHPLYALRRHLLKFESIYPDNALTLGYIRNEPIYSRDCVHTLHSREIWVKQARTVKVGEKPYKIVKAQ